MKIKLTISESWASQRLALGHVGENSFHTVEIYASA
jgi:hypothetical protein